MTKSVRFREIQEKMARSLKYHEDIQKNEIPGNKDAQAQFIQNMVKALTDNTEKKVKPNE